MELWLFLNIKKIKREKVSKIEKEMDILYPTTYDLGKYRDIEFYIDIDAIKQESQRKLDSIWLEYMKTNLKVNHSSLNTQKQ